MIRTKKALVLFCTHARPRKTLTNSGNLNRMVRRVKSLGTRGRRDTPTALLIRRTIFEWPCVVEWPRDQTNACDSMIINKENEYSGGLFII